MKTIIAYLMAFTMLVSVTTQVVMPVLAANEESSVSSIALTDSSLATSQEVTLPLLGAASDAAAESASEDMEDGISTSQSDSTASSEAVSDSTASSEAVSDSTASSEAASDSTASSEAVSDSTVSSEAVSDSTVSSEVVSDSTASSEAVSDSTASSEAVSDELVEAEDADDSQQESAVVGTNSAQLEVMIQAAMPMGQNLPVQVVLTDAAGTSYDVTGSLSANAEGGAAALTLKLDSLEPGSYTAVVNAAGFAPYTQVLELKSATKSSITLYTGEVKLNDSVHGGLLLLGDVNGDGELNSADTTALLDMIGTESADTVVKGDLNRDGVVDLVDLQYLAANFVDAEGTAKEQVLSTVETHISTQAIKPTVAESTEVQSGSVENLLNNNEAVTLAPAAGQEISQTAPVEVAFDIAQQENGEHTTMDGIVIETGASNEQAAVKAGTILVEYVDGTTKEIPFDEAQQARAFALFALFSNEPTVSVNNGVVSVNFGGQVAVKRVVLTITQTMSNNLAEISKVDFVNGMENRIPEPEMNIPQNLKAVPDDKTLTLSWKAEQNVTGYEVEVTGPTKKGGSNVTQVIGTSANKLEVKLLNNEKLVNGETYTIRVRSVNGEWKSAYSESITAKPIAVKLPAAPDNLEVTGGYKCIDARWKDMEDTDTYTVLYRKKADGQDAPYITAAANIKSNSLRINNLEDATEYEVVVYGTNDLGNGPNSIPSLAKTQTLLEAKLPDYLTLTTGNRGELASHIKSVVRTGEAGGSKMVDSPLDTETNTALGLFDGDQGTYYYCPDWDLGVMYHQGSWGIKTEFDEALSLGGFSFAEPTNGSVGSVSIYYWNEEGKMVALSGKEFTLSMRSDENGRRYGYIHFKREVKTDKVLVGFSTGWVREIKIAEMRFYGYDGIYEDIMGLYSDAYHTTLRTDVTRDDLNKLSDRLETPDANSGEKHPNYTTLRRELDGAIKLFEEGGSLGEVQHVKAMGANIGGYADKSLGFTGLNPWQPLGITAAAGEEVTIYVGNPLLQMGDNTDLYLVATQHNAESGNFVQQIARLRVGENTVTIPAIVSKDFERGGSLYIYYAASNKVSDYGVRVEGGTHIPTLDVYGVDDEAERLERITAYVTELEAYVADLENKHSELHQNSENSNVHYDYNEQECILNATEMMSDTMLFSLSAEQVLKGLGTGTVEQKAQKLNNSLLAMDQMMLLFYQHKGLVDSDAEAINRIPSQHLNIRYMRMFAGAFMYASGNHIGIGWGSIPGLASGVPVVADELGRYQSGNYFGWGIAHEIGHDINQGSYAVAEVTNNYFSQLATFYESNATRFGYSAIYNKVTSGVIGHSTDVFTQLGMYWQLRLAYDNYFPYKLFTDYTQVLPNLFFARVDTYARTPSKAPKAAENGVALTLNGDADQNFMRLASAAAQKDLTDFFTRWGMVPNEETKAYMNQWPVEERAIYYVNDNAQKWRIENPNGETFEGKDVLSAEDVKLAQGSMENGLAQNQVKLDIAPASAGNVLGYEINRILISGGKENRQTVGFVLADGNGAASFTDTINSINNRVFTYEVVAIDKYLNRANALDLEPIKISHDGSQDKTDWTVTTNMTSSQDSTVIPGEDDPDNGFNPGSNNKPTVNSAINLVVDDSLSTTFTGSVSEGQPTIEMNFGKELDVTGFKFTLNAGYTLPEGQFTVQLKEQGQWVDVSTEVDTITTTGSTTVYFTTEGGWLRTSGAEGMRLVFTGTQTVSITELDVLGPTGDNVELFADGMGILKEDYKYGGKDEDVIPAGSIVFTGSYKGNPAFNVVILYDQDGKIVGYDESGEGESSQIILAPVPEEGDLANTSDGRWVYWISDSAVLPEKVRIELYRVDDAQTNNGQRLVSDSNWATVPSKLPELVIDANTAE